MTPKHPPGTPVALDTPAGNLLVTLVLPVLRCVWQGIPSCLADFLL